MIGSIRLDSPATIFGFVEVGRLAKHMVNGTGLFTNGSHLYDHAWKHIRIGHGIRQAGTG